MVQQRHAVFARDAERRADFGHQAIPASRSSKGASRRWASSIASRWNRISFPFARSTARTTMPSRNRRSTARFDCRSVTMLLGLGGVSPPRRKVSAIRDARSASLRMRARSCVAAAEPANWLPRLLMTPRASRRPSASSSTAAPVPGSAGSSFLVRKPRRVRREQRRDARQQVIHVRLAQHPALSASPRTECVWSSSTMRGVASAESCDRCRSVVPAGPSRCHFRGDHRRRRQRAQILEPLQDSRAIASLRAAFRAREPCRRRPSVAETAGAVSRARPPGPRRARRSGAGQSRSRPPRARPDPAGASEHPISCVPSIARSLVPFFSGGAPSTARMDIVSQSELSSASGAASAMPRFSSAISTSRRFSATRWPGVAAVTLAPWT